MLINNIKIIAQTTEPNPREVDYWINTSVDPNGGLIMFHDGKAWHPVNEHHDLFQEELIKREVERAKAAEAKLQVQVNEINELLVEEGDGTKFLADDGSYKEINTIPYIIKDDLLSLQPILEEIDDTNTMLPTNFDELSEVVFDSNRPIFLSTGGSAGNRNLVPVSVIPGELNSNGSYVNLKIHNSLFRLWQMGITCVLKDNKGFVNYPAIPVYNVSNYTIFATINESSSFLMQSNNDVTKFSEVHVVINNTSTSDVTVTLPTASPYVCMNGDSLTIPANGYAEVNAISDGTNIYLRAL